MSKNSEKNHDDCFDPQGYGPDVIINEATKERINPMFDQRERPEIGFLWPG